MFEIKIKTFISFTQLYKNREIYSASTKGKKLLAFLTCPKCDGHFFELQITSSARSAFQLSFIQCNSCGAVVGVMDAMNIGAMLEWQNEAIKRIARAVNISVNL
jgi:uncharacterized protein YbaR (Trm112 family)